MEASEIPKRNPGWNNGRGFSPSLLRCDGTDGRKEGDRAAGLYYYIRTAVQYTSRAEGREETGGMESLQHLLEC